EGGAGVGRELVEVELLHHHRRAQVVRQIRCSADRASGCIVGVHARDVELVVNDVERDALWSDGGSARTRQCLGASDELAMVIGPLSVAIDGYRVRASAGQNPGAGREELLASLVDAEA